MSLALDVVVQFLSALFVFLFFSGLARLAITHSAMNLPVYPPGLTSGERGGATRKEPNKECMNSAIVSMKSAIKCLSSSYTMIGQTTAPGPFAAREAFLIRPAELGRIYINSE